MDSSLFDYPLPPDLIAQAPLERRDGSRLLVADSSGASIEDAHFRELPERLALSFDGARPLVVRNRSRVYPARVRTRRASGARGEVLLLDPQDSSDCACLLRPLKKLRLGEVLLADRDEGEPAPLFRVTSLEPPRVEPLVRPLSLLMEQFGEMPLPPYILRDPHRVGRGWNALDRERYQTVYSRETGSAASTTAGLHFTEDVENRCKNLGCDFVDVILHVGLGTFQPMQADRVDDHPMHAEHFSVPRETAGALANALATGRPVVFVGTTSLRAVESFLRLVFPHIPVEGLRGALPRESNLRERLLARADEWHSTSLFLRPGEGGGVRLPATGHALITNFHGPRTTLTVLVASLLGYDFWRRIYSHAVESKYRFLSYGDSSLLRFASDFDRKK